MWEISVYVDIVLKMLIIIKEMIMMNSVGTLLSIQEMEMHKCIF